MRLVTSTNGNALSPQKYNSSGPNFKLKYTLNKRPADHLTTTSLFGHTSGLTRILKFDSDQTSGIFPNSFRLHQARTIFSSKIYSDGHQAF
jgi:hypothetical protein